MKLRDLQERDARFMGLAETAATWSEDRSTGVGCVLVKPDNYLNAHVGSPIAITCNGFPRGAHDLEERHERPAKYKWTEHAERNAIYTAARNGISTVGCTAYVNWTPCVDCARALVQAGIIRVVMRPADFEDLAWGEDFKIALAMFAEAGVMVTEIEGPAGVRR